MNIHIQNIHRNFALLSKTCLGRIINHSKKKKSQECIDNNLNFFFLWMKFLKVLYKPYQNGFLFRKLRIQSYQKNPEGTLF